MLMPAPSVIPRACLLHADTRRLRSPLFDDHRPEACGLVAGRSFLFLFFYFFILLSHVSFIAANVPCWILAKTTQVELYRNWKGVSPSDSCRQKSAMVVRSKFLHI